MKTIYNGSGATVTLYWKIMRGENKVTEDLSNLKSRVFLIGSCNTYSMEPDVVTDEEFGNKVLKVEVDASMLCTGVYDVKAIWEKNDGRNIMKSARTGVFAITDNIEEVDEIKSEEVIRIASYVESIGRDGLSAYEIAVIRGLNNGLSENDWVGNEAERIKAEQERDSAETTRNEEEIKRKNAESGRQSRFNTFMEASTQEFDAAQENRAVDFVAAQGGREAAFTEKIGEFEARFNEAEANRNDGEAARNTNYATAEKERDNDYATAEANRDKKYGQAEATRNSTIDSKLSDIEFRFNDAEDARKTIFNNNEDSRQTNEQYRIQAEGKREKDFQDNERRREQTFQNNEVTRQSNEIKREAQEIIRQQAEQIRIDTFDENERGRISAENERKQNETQREANEAIRQESYLDKLPVSAVVQNTGDGENVVMSQKAVSGKLAELKSEIEGIIKQELVGEDTLLWINANGELNSTLPDYYGSKKYNIDGIKGVVEVSSPLEGNEVISLYTILDSQGRTITHGNTTNISSKAVIDLDSWPSAKELYVAFAVSNKNTSAAIKYDFKAIAEKQKEENKKLLLKDEELVKADSEIKGQILDLKETYYEAKEQYIPIVEGNVFDKGEFYEVYNAGQSFRNKTSEIILFNTITFALKSSSDNDILRIFKVSKDIWYGTEYIVNKQFTDTTIFTKLYESKFVNDGKDRTIQLADIISLAPDESIFVVLFGEKKTFTLRTTTFEQGRKSFGYPTVFSLSTEVNGNIGCYYGYNEYSSYPISLSLRTPYILAKDAYYRTKINIKVSDDEISILHKMIDAYNLGDCDVYFEKGEYVFSEIYPYMQNVLGWTWENGKGLPIGNGCRYYFNNSTLISNPIAGYTSTRNILDSVPMTASSYELYDALLICNGGTYCVHDEGNANDAAYIHLYKNMRMRYDAQGVGTGGCIGAGTGYNAIIKIEDCYFWTNKENGYPIGIHGVVNNPNNKSVDFALYCSNSYFNQASISFNVFNATRDNVFVQFNNNRTTLDFDGKSGLKTVIMWNNTK